MSNQQDNQHKNLPEWLHQIAEAHLDENILHSKPSPHEPFANTTWRQFRDSYHSIAVALMRECDIQLGDRVAIMGSIGQQWTTCDLGIIAAGGVTVPIYHTCSVDELSHILADSRPKAIFVDSEAQARKLFECSPDLYPARVYVFARGHLDNLMALGNSADREALVASRREQLNQDCLATIVYTSGTSGSAKGVVLTHGNVTTQLRSIPALLELRRDQGDSLLAFLTPAHIFERIAGEWYFLSRNCPIYYCPRMERIQQYLRESEASIILAVPLILEKIESKLQQRLQSLPPLKRKAANLALETAIGCEARGIGIGRLLQPAKQLVAPKLKAIVSGGAKLGTRQLLCFKALGIQVLEGYGLTETTGIVSVNPIYRARHGSVGKMIDTLEARIADDGELLLRGDVVTPGYWQIPSPESFTEDGFFPTGDLSRFDQDGYLYITGRKKDLIITAGGKNVSPIQIECRLQASPYISQAAVFGEGQRWLGALVCPEKDAVLKKLSVSEGDWLSVLGSDELQDLLRSEISACCGGLPEWEKVRRFRILEEPFSREKGELTPTMKLKRKVIAQHYSQPISELFSSET